ncbi:MAG: NmrA family NAD(P)-binding protein [Verrucomicrobia bacterium]|nr:NmrA family NAD(P)-binding protein [Verrucomicrobiota bacterium]
MKVLVTGATGRVGGEVVKALLQRGAAVRALTRKQPKPGTFPSAVEIALGDLTDPVSTAEALKGVDKLFLLIAGVPDELVQALTAYSLSKRAGLKHVTYLSVFKADEFLEVPHFAAKYPVEESMRAGRLPYTILRPAYFVQNERGLKPALTGLGVYPIPAGNHGVAVVDIRDIAEAAAISLTEEGHEGKTYDLVSSEMLTGPDAALIWSKLLGKEITYAGHGDFDNFEAQLRKTGNPMREKGTSMNTVRPSWLAHDLRLMFEGFVERGFRNTEDQTARFAALLGHPPRTYSSYAEELATEWAAA